MANLFSSKNNKPIPASLEECTKADETSATIYHWAETIESWGQILLIVIVLIGIVDSIVSASSTSEIFDDLGLSRYSDTSSFMTFVTSAIKWALIAVVEYFVYHIVAVLLRALASITQSTRVTANVALYTAKASIPPVNTEIPPVPVPNPGNTMRNENEDKAPVRPVSTENGFVVCPACKTRQRADRKVCYTCGQKFKEQ